MACVFYLYTGKVNFLPLNSQGKAERQFAMLTAKVGAAPACSSKSIYRLAESVCGILSIFDESCSSQQALKFKWCRLVWYERPARTRIQRYHLTIDPGEYRDRSVFKFLCKVTFYPRPS